MQGVDAAEVGVGEAVARVELQGDEELLDGFGKLSHDAQGEGEIGASAEIIGVAFEAFAIALSGMGIVALLQ